jgi:hypothetical protein
MFRIRVALPPLCLYPMKDLYISIVSVTYVTVTDHEDGLLLTFDLVPTACISCSFCACVILYYVILYNLT